MCEIVVCLAKHMTCFVFTLRVQILNVHNLNNLNKYFIDPIVLFYIY